MNTFKIERVGSRGDGLAHQDGKAVFVPKTCPGDVVEGNAAAGFKIIAASSERQVPFCRYYENCGGCKFQHWQQQPYADWKRRLVSDALQAKGLDASVLPVVDAHGQGRRRVSLHVRKKVEIWVAGFMAAKSHDLVAIEHCPILVPQLIDAPAIAASFGPLLGECDVAITAAENGLDVNVKAERQAANKHMPQIRQLCEKYNIQRVALNSEILAQLNAPTIIMGAARLQLPIASFLQATALGEETLVKLLREPLRKAKNILDLFCGLGPFAIRLAENAKVHGIDSDKNAIAALQQSMRFTQGLKPLTAEARDLFDNPLVPAELNEFDAVVFDPPRAGAEAQARNLAKSKVKTIVAVACDASSFARDAALLVAGGFKLKQVTPVDQFKYSAHVEIVAAFTRRP